MSRAPAPVPAVVVALETSTRRGSLALRAGAARLEADLAEGRSHAADLLPELERLLRRAGVARAPGALAVGAIVVGTGPGSYTGLRVGIATSLGLARACGALLIGVPSIEALAFQELSPGEVGAALLDARASRFYFALYRRGERELSILEPPCTLTADELAERLPPAVRILGSGAAVEELVPTLPGRIRLALPHARAVLALGERRLELGETGTLELEPLYLMAPPAKAPHARRSGAPEPRTTGEPDPTAR